MDSIIDLTELNNLTESGDDLWKLISKIADYEGAQYVPIIKINGDYRMVMLTSVNEKTGKNQAEVPGGKCKIEDFTDSNGPLTKRKAIFATAERCFLKETGSKLGACKLLEILETTGGTTGTPSYQILVEIFTPIELNSKESKWTGIVYTTIYPIYGEYLTSEGVVVRNFNKYFIEQHSDVLRKLKLLQ